MIRRVQALLGGFVFSVSAAQSQETTVPENVQQGRRLADLICSNCHVVASDQSFSPILQPPAPSFDTLAQRSTMSADWLRTFLVTTHRDTSSPAGMPNPQLIDSQIEQVTAYLLSLRSQPRTQTKSCSAEIARLEPKLNQARTNRAVVGSYPESTAARLHRQPTPRTVERAETEAERAIEKTLALARQLESDGKDSECMAAVKKIPPLASAGAPLIPAFTASKRTAATASSDVRKLLRLMDKDRSGSVSKDEFMQFVSQTFDRLDVNKSGELDRRETFSATFPFGVRTNAAAKVDVQQLLRTMDTDKSGTVSKDEFLQFMSEMFDRLDVNKNDQLEREELRQLDDPNWLVCHDLRIC
jgi:Ca2+-binding EF-hand superfamily protein/mono/diheme cytochrome c family protein